MMNLKQQDLSSLIITSICYYYCALLAASTVLTHVSQLMGISFKNYALAIGVLSIFSLVLTFQFIHYQIPKVKTYDYKVLFLMLLLGIGGSCMALMSHKPDADDFYYIPNAVYLLQHPDQALSFNIHFLVAGQYPISSHSWGTSIPFELFQAAFAYLFNINYLDFYYVINLAVIGFLIPSALLLIIAPFVRSSTDALIGACITILVLLLLGETHRTYGNFLFNRAFQGKTLLLAVGIPFFASMTIRFYQENCFSHWFALFLIVTSMVGATASTIIILCPLALILALTFFVNDPLRFKHIRRYLSYFLSLGYLVLYALYLLLFSDNAPTTHSHVNEGWPITFIGHVNFFLSPQIPITPVVVITGMVLCLFLSEHRKFFAIWIIASIVLLLNPLAANPLIRYFTTPNAYWRLFYILPFPLMLGIVLGLMFNKVQNRFSKSASLALLSLAIMGLVILHIPKSSTSVFRRTTTTKYFPHFKYKLNPNIYNVAKKIVLVAPSGPMLSPRDICGIIPLISADYPQLRIRLTAVKHWLSKHGLIDEALVRISASDYVSGDNDNLRPAFIKLLEQYSSIINSIVLKKDVYEKKDNSRLVKEYGFNHHKLIDDYIIVWK